jgi:hypothetical protein
MKQALEVDREAHTQIKRPLWTYTGLSIDIQASGNSRPNADYQLNPAKSLLD